MVDKKSKIKLVPFYLWRFRSIVAACLIITVGLTYAVYKGFTSKQATNLDQLISEEGVLKTDLITKYQLIKSVPLYEKKLPELDSLESNVLQQFPLSDELPNLLIQINQLAENDHVAIASFSPINPENAAMIDASGVKDVKISSESFNINLSANYDDLVRFIFEIARVPRVIKIENLKISRIDDTKINATFVLTIFYRG